MNSGGSLHIPLRPALMLESCKSSARNKSPRLTWMFGKAVKIRHCPATVSASSVISVVSGRREAFGIPGHTPLENLREGGSERRKSGDRSLVPITDLRSEGDGGYRCLSFVADQACFQEDVLPFSVALSAALSACSHCCFAP